MYNDMERMKDIREKSHGTLHNHENLMTVHSHSLYLLMVQTRSRCSWNLTSLKENIFIDYVTTQYHLQYGTDTYSHEAAENSTFWLDDVWLSYCILEWGWLTGYKPMWKPKEFHKRSAIGTKYYSQQPSLYILFHLVCVKFRQSKTCYC
jgi:hypothetical protein